MAPRLTGMGIALTGLAAGAEVDYGGIIKTYTRPGLNKICANPPKHL